MPKEYFRRRYVLDVLLRMLNCAEIIILTTLKMVRMSSRTDLGTAELVLCIFSFMPMPAINTTGSNFGTIRRYLYESRSHLQIRFIGNRKDLSLLSPLRA